MAIGTVWGTAKLSCLGHPLPGAYEMVEIAAGVTVACAQVVLVTLWHLLHPGQPLIKP